MNTQYSVGKIDSNGHRLTVVVVPRDTNCDQVLRHILTNLNPAELSGMWKFAQWSDDNRFCVFDDGDSNPRPLDATCFTGLPFRLLRGPQDGGLVA